MKTRNKWILAVVLVFLVIFAAGFTKSVLEEKRAAAENRIYSLSEKTGVATGIAVPQTTIDAEYDTVSWSGSDEEHYYGKGFGSGEDVQYELRIIRTANMGLEVEDYFIAAQKIEGYATKYDGYVSDSNSWVENKNRNTGRITIRVPEIYFDAAIAEISMIGEVTSKSISGNDVTEESIDIESRIKNSKVHEEQLLKMYENATNIDEMMRIEKELSRVREQIETNEGRLRYLNDRVEMSSITASLYEPMPAVTETGLWESAKKALNHSITTLKWMIEIIGWLLPLALIGVFSALIIRRIRKMRSRNVRR